MPRDIVVIGASAGGVQALSDLVSGLPADLPAAVFVAHHFPTGGHSVLPAILSRSGPLKAVHPSTGEKIRHGMIYVSPPDRHLLLGRGCITLSAGPKENGNRPAIDPMFRSAAREFGGRVVGVILTGMLDDGVAGLMAIKARGGAAIVQSPEDAASRGMPENAIKYVEVDRVVPLSQVAQAIVELVADGPSSEGPDLDERTRKNLEEEMSIGNPPPPIEDAHEMPGELTMYTCPECHGTLWEVREGTLRRYRCHVGHSYTEETFLSEKADALESALWSALRAMQEHAIVLSNMIQRAQAHGHEHSVKRLVESHLEAERRISVIRDVLMDRSFLQSGDCEEQENEG